MNLKQVFDACPADKKIVIHDFYCVPVVWISPTDGQPTEVIWMASIGHDLYAELTLTGRLGSIWPEDAENFKPAWKETKEEQFQLLKGLVEQLLATIGV